jgi:hypothetical protein
MESPLFPPDLLMGHELRRSGASADRRTLSAFFKMAAFCRDAATGTRPTARLPVPGSAVGTPRGGRFPRLCGPKSILSGPLRQRILDRLPTLTERCHSTKEHVPVRPLLTGDSRHSVRSAGLSACFLSWQQLRQPSDVDTARVVLWPVRSGVRTAHLGVACALPCFLGRAVPVPICSRD